MNTSKLRETTLTFAQRFPLRGFSCLPAAAILILALSWSGGRAHAANIWDGGGANANWDTVNNWDNNTLPLTTITITFGTAFTSGTSINLNGDRTADALSINSTTSFSLDNNTLTLTDGDIARSAVTGTTTINSAVVIVAAAAWNIAGSSAAGSLIVNGIVDDGVGTITLTKSGNGTLTLNGNNTHGGGVTLNAGTLVLGHDNAAGSGTLDLSGGTIQGTGGTRTIANNLTISGNNTFSGSGDLIFTDSFDQGLARTYTVNNTTTFSGSVSGSDALTKSGTGTLILSGDNSLGTTIDLVTVNTGGALRVANNGALGETVLFGTDVDSGGALELVGGRTIGAEALSLSGTGVSGGGALRNVSGDSSWAGVITLANVTGVHRINSDSGRLTIGAGGITETGNSNNKDLTFGGAGDVTVNGIISSPGTLDMRLFKDGSGSLTLTGANSYDGITTVNEGTLIVGANAPLSASGALGNAATAVLVGNTLGTADASLLIGGAFTVGRAVTVQTGNSGVMTLGGSTDNNSTFGGLITLQKSATVTQVATTGGNALTISGGTTETGVGTKTLTIAGAGDVTVSGVVGSGGGTEIALVKDGAGTLTVGAATANLYAGGTTLNQGTLRMATADALGTGGFTFAGGILDVNNTVSPTSLGALTLTGDSTLSFAGGAAGSIRFGSAGLTPTGTLLVTGWDGTPGVSGTDKFLMTTDPGSLIDHIIFDLGGGDLRFAQYIGPNQEIVATVTPVPEPINVALGVFGALFVVVGIGRRLQARARAQA